MLSALAFALAAEPRQRPALAAAAAAATEQAAAAAAATEQAWLAAVTNPWAAGMWEASGGPYRQAWQGWPQHQAWLQPQAYTPWVPPRPVPQPQTQDGATAEATAARHFKERERSRQEKGEMLDAIRQQAQRDAQQMPVLPHLAPAGAATRLAPPGLARGSRWGPLGDVWQPPSAVVESAQVDSTPHGWARGGGGHIAGPQ